MEGHDSKTETWISIFHPLQQNWPEHFVILADAVIVGMTATGRITVDALRMNDLIPQAARFLQMKLGFL